MKTIYRIAKLELQTLFYSPVAWLIIVIFALQAAITFTDDFGNAVRHQELGSQLWDTTRSLFSSVFSGLYPPMIKHLYLYIPLLTMGLMSREFSSGSIKLLYSSPVTNVQIILGKFLSMMIFGLTLIGVLLFFVFFAGCYVENFDFPTVLIGLLGIYLLICAYASIGLFMSSLTSYQIVAAIFTFIMLSALNYVRMVGQGIEFVRDITYWLSISGRVEEFIKGLLCSEDLLYFIIVIALFISLTIIQLQARRQKTPWRISFSRYLGTIAFACFLGYLSSRPALMTYYDATATKNNTLTEHSQEVISKLKGDLTITTYVNALDISHLLAATPKRVISDQKNHFQRYIRFKPEIKFKYVYYYDTIADPELEKRYPKMTTEQRAKKIIKHYHLDSTLFLTPEQIRNKINLFPEGNRFVRLLERGSGEKTFLRVYNDQNRFPSEREITAAFKRIAMTLPKVGFLIGHGERDIKKIGDRDYNNFAQEKPFRYALINQGFDVEEVTLDQQIPTEINILVIAEPREDIPEHHMIHLDQYIARGGNLLIACEPNRIKVMRPLLEKFGVEQVAGTLVKLTENYAPNLILSTPTIAGCKLIGEFLGMYMRNQVIISNEVSGLKYKINKGYDIIPLFSTDSLVWNEIETTDFVDDTLIFNPEQGEKQREYITALALKRPMGNKEQKIIILGDADYISNGELNRTRKGIKANNFSLITGGFYWLSDEEVPINITRPNSTDNHLAMGEKVVNIWKIILVWCIPGILIIAFILLWLRRRGR